MLGSDETHGEVCPDALVIIEQMSNRLKEYGGAGLIADYGEETIKDFTFRVSKTNINILVD